MVPRKEVEIKPQISGIVDKLYVEPGDAVKQGDLIEFGPPPQIGRVTEVKMTYTGMVTLDNVQISAKKGIDIRFVRACEAFGAKR